ncbi:unnamed protein product, partial [Musa hybrid cultivar]
LLSSGISFPGRCRQWGDVGLEWRRWLRSLWRPPSSAPRSLPPPTRCCRRAKAVFKESKKAPYVVELDQCEDGSQIQDALSGMVGKHTVPQVFIHGKHLGGSDDTVEAYESGRILTLLGLESKDNL